MSLFCGQGGGGFAFLKAEIFHLWILAGDTLISSSRRRNKMEGKDGPGGGSRTHTGSDPRQILSLLRLPVPPLRENCTENSMSGVWGKGAASLSLTFVKRESTLACNMPPEDGKISGDPAVVSQLFRDFFELYRQWLDRLAAVTDRAMEVNKQIISLNERLMLLNLGTIGISVSALISLGTKVASNPAARHAFVRYVAPSWVLLLLSAMMCRNVMVFTIGANRKLLEDWTQRVTSFNIVQMQRSVLKMSKALTGTITVNSVSHDVSAMFAETAKEAENVLEQLKKGPGPPVTPFDNRASKWQARLSVLFMQIALILLCIAAIKLFLWS